MPRSAKYPDRLMPTASQRATWREAAKKLKLTGPKAQAYSQRWLSLWRMTLDIAREQDEWDDRHVWLVSDYVEARRLAYEHQLAADHAGRYARNAQSGRTFAHPALDKAREARRESRDIAAELCITPEAMRNAGFPEDPEGDEETTGGDQAGL